MTRIQWLVVIAIAALLISICWVEVMRGEDPATANRETLARDLRNLGLRAQDYYHRATVKGGGQGSFCGLTADACGLAKLTWIPVNNEGTFSVMCAGDASHVKLHGVGHQRGTDGCLLSVDMDVLADSMYVKFNN